MMATGKRILVVDDEAKMRRLLELALRNLGHEVGQADDGESALAALADSAFDLVITDLRMPRMDGLAMLRALRQRNDDVPVIVLTAHGSIESAVEAMKLGAIDYVIRPFEMETIELAVTRALALDVVARENRFLRDEAARGWDDFVGASPEMQALYRLVRQVAPARSSVLVLGDTGTGKELVARALHRASGRRGLFVAVNCAAIPGDLLESELFGHARGAFTGAVRERVGKFELASGGTIFLDEVTEMAPALQAKLLRVLQEGTFERLGTNTVISVDLRVVAATNRDPQAAVEAGLLRRDLYYRLNVVRIDVPLLRERQGDIALLAPHLLARFATEIGRPVPSLAPDALRALEAYPWPGNVRELQNVMERAAVLCEGSEVTLDQLPAEIAELTEPLPSREPEADRGDHVSLKARIEAVERELIAEALRETADNKSAAARRLAISERALWYKIKRYGL